MNIDETYEEDVYMSQDFDPESPIFVNDSLERDGGSNGFIMDNKTTEQYFMGDPDPSEPMSDNGFDNLHAESLIQAASESDHTNTHDKAGDLSQTSGDHSNISFSIPGAFKENNYMEIDNSPPFTIDSDLFFDSASNNNNNSNHNTTNNQSGGKEASTRETLFPHNQFFIRQYKNSLSSSNQGHSPNNNVSPNSNVVGSNVNTPVPTQNPHFDTPNSVINPNYLPSENQYYDDASVYSSIVNDNESVDNHSQFNRRSISMTQTNLSVGPYPPVNPYANDLSPLTTTTSLTHSVNSLHSTQPSFFSAHQYLPRHSLEVPLSHRNSVDYISKNRNSIEPSTSVQRQPRANNNRYLSFTNSISNYIPFMGDKNNSNNNNNNQRTSPISGPPSPISNGSGSTPFMNQPAAQRQQSKHLIRSIFKLNPQNAQESMENPEVNDNESPDIEGITEEITASEFDRDLNAEFLVLSPTGEESELYGLNPLPNNISSKKVKKPKRSIFTRFKGPVKQESTDELDFNNDDSSKHSGNNSSNQELDDPQSFDFHGNMSRTPSSANTVRTGNNLQPNLEITNSNGSSHFPDYAALFENVGKRKMIGKNSTFKNKTRVKTEKSGTDTFDEDNDTSFMNTKVKHEKQEFDTFDNDVDSFPNSKVSFEASSTVSSSTTAHSRHPSQYEDSMHDDDDYDRNENGGNSTNVLSNASKRILGSKLMKRKPSKKESELKNIKTKVMADGVEVEVDMKTLNLPQDAQAFPISVVNSKTRTRGRKENKEADLSDSTKIYLCTYCSRRFKRQEHLKRHFRSLHTFEKPYSCDICNKKFSRTDNLNQHLKTHKEEEAAAEAAAAAAAAAATLGEAT
ncbi:hypothetical protein PSN45_004136 [Yamadazyma tenuis]|uniref:C2H2-type domain-containing protein n=1 Tax=Candida tenuis (strain ATCC 10573 / BCRC 21748 / CBS 615 / JCM 9827 / NBRC 10315 / NRRL Y-1498 / VKM Y-70) TaxID=590646 RepID=G3B474_CANTC|nr:uncharacterized protein CANTEDRAFT_93309 [Yamadazyma tenuis ATCC 10573]EGV63793.1 hypothetical protein CANTEDRAFT_93309 [Yamadazyma tenuis ATCC 10573]WEJ96596.1 hypothetical protein PSN45_004136 [Yamadazyma tenuis]